MTNRENGWPMEIAEREGRNIEECGCSRNRRPLIHNTPDIGVNPINGLLTIVRTIETERIKRKEEESGKRQAGTGTGEKFTSAEEGEDDIMKNRWESMRGKRDEKREKDRREERSLFVWKEDLKHVVPLYTRIVRGSRLGKIKKKTVYWRNRDSGRVGWCAGSREKNDVPRETRNRDEGGWTEDKGE